MKFTSTAHWKALTAWLSMTSNIAVILGLFALDIRDLYYKLAWIGPAESFSFRTGSKSILHPEPLRVSRDHRLVNESTPLDSGWPSFLSRCDSLHALVSPGSLFFLSAVGTNCLLGDATTVQRLVMASDQRVDALTWASCLLLQTDRRPSVCYEPLVANFHRRYRFKETPLSASFPPVAADTDAEKELLAFLDVVATSYPLHSVICVEAFALEDEDELVSTFYSPTFFGCASANAVRSAFVGVANPRVAQLAADKAWLTADLISLVGTEYLIRQNCRTAYEVFRRGAELVAIRVHTSANFSSFGSLYALVIAIDVALLVLNCRSSFELVRWMSFPTLADVQAWVDHKERQRLASRRKSSGTLVRMSSWLLAGRQVMAANSVITAATDGGSVAPTVAGPKLGSRLRSRRRLQVTMEAMSGATSIADEQLYSFFSRSLYRNPRVVALTLATQLLSWLLVLPNAVVWTWSDAYSEKLHAYMSSIRCWVLLLLLCNLAWGGVFVRVSERAAYAVTKRTFVTSVDLVLVAAGVSFLHRRNVFAMSERKWHVERQRVNDATSFIGGFLAHGNTFHAALDTVDTTPLRVWYTLYSPLLDILLTGVALVAAVLAAKAAYFAHQRAWRQRVARGVKQIARRLSSSSASLRKIMAMGVGDGDDSEPEDDTALAMALDAPYQRLPLEEWLDKPIRATSLVRTGLLMETLREGKRLIRPSCYLDFGLIVKRGVIHSRIGFGEIWKAKMTVQEYMARVEHDGPSAGTIGGAAASADRTSVTMSSVDHSRLSSASSLRRIPTATRVSSTGAQLQRKRSLHVPLG